MNYNLILYIMLGVCFITYFRQNLNKASYIGNVMNGVLTGFIVYTFGVFTLDTHISSYEVLDFLDIHFVSSAQFPRIFVSIMVGVVTSITSFLIIEPKLDLGRNSEYWYGYEYINRYTYLLPFRLMFRKVIRNWNQTERWLHDFIEITVKGFVTTMSLQYLLAYFGCDTHIGYFGLLYGLLYEFGYQIKFVKNSDRVVLTYILLIFNSLLILALKYNF